MSQLKRSKLDLRGLLIGMLLGDGSLSFPTSKSNSRLSIGHSIIQKNYCEHKLSLIANLLRIDYNVKDYKVFNKKTNKHYPTVQGSTHVHRYLTKLRKLLYDEHKKVITEKTLRYLTLEGLAYWYMDDGGVISANKRKSVSGVFLSTQCFSYEEHLLIKNWFNTKFSIQANIVKHGNGQFRIKINKTNSVKFLDLIKPYILEQFNYKTQLDYNNYVKIKAETLSRI